MRLSNRFALAVSLAVLGAAAGAQAAVTSLAITNASFEDPALPVPMAFTTSVPGWLSTGATGVFVPHIPSVYAGVPDGSQVGYIHETGSLHQVLGAQLLGGADYALTVRVGDRGDLDMFGNMVAIANYRVALYLEDAGNPGDLGAATLLGDATGPMPADGAFATATVNYSAPGALGALAGRNLIVALFHSLGTIEAETVYQINFDDVALTQRVADEVPVNGQVPEPAGLALFGLGLAGLAAVRRRRRS